MKKIKIGTIGLGYVGLPVSIAFSKKYKVVGYDINLARTTSLNNFIDSTQEISKIKLKTALRKNLSITNDIEKLRDCNIYIITVPTPINLDKTPDLSALLDATKSVGKILSRNDIVIYESTVYPGCTEEMCVPILEFHSKLIYNKSFFCGYSPERINPGDKKHTIEKIVKVVSGSTPSVTKLIDKLYSSVIDAGTYVAKSIKIAEAAKVIENSQRDINIAFINELAIIFNRMNIDTNDVLDAASTKWNFLNFRPGLVGGHCIGVDPYYLAYKAEKEGYSPEIILAGRKVNDYVGEFVANQVIDEMKKRNLFSNPSVLVMGVTFKENCPDFRNTKVIDILLELKKNKLNLDIYDPLVDKESFKKQHNLVVHNTLPNKKYHAIILAVAHDEFKCVDFESLQESSKTVVYDVKGFLEKKVITNRL
jgi:UDP-N-acetyl-D-galactosamine dehydrogenase